MRGIRIIAVAVMAGLMTSCNPMDISVTQKLNGKQLERAIDLNAQDTLFPKFYDQVQINLELMSETTRLEYKEMSYKRLFNYYKKTQQLSDKTAFGKSLYTRWFKEFEEKIGTYEAPTDSVVNGYRELHRKNPLDPEIPPIIAVYLDKEESDKTSADYLEKRERFKHLMSLEFFTNELGLETFLQGKKDSLFKEWDSLAWRFFYENK